MDLGPGAHRALLLALNTAFIEHNAERFQRQLRAPLIELSDTQRLGCWHPATRRIELSLHMVTTQRWGVVQAVLLHEMAHQYVSEVLRIAEPAHGPAFRRVCADRGIDATARGLPQGDPTREDPILRKIRKLMALAESPNPHEAQAAMNKAQALMLRHNVESLNQGTRAFDFRQVGPAKGRFDPWEKQLASLIGHHFFVQVIWVPTFRAADGRWVRVLELLGTPSNLEMAAYVHDTLRDLGERLWRAHRKSRRIKGNTERRRYLYGVMTGFSNKLESSVAKEAERGLVWVGDPGLDDWMRQRFPRIRTTRGRPVRISEAYDQGREAGGRIVLNRPITGSKSRGRLLGG